MTDRPVTGRSVRSSNVPTAGPRAGKRRPAELDDPAWLHRQLRTKGTMTIALELGVSRSMVRRACERLGLESHPDGPRRGVPTATILPSARQRADDPTETAFRERYQRAKQRRVPPTEDTLVAAIHAAHEARRREFATAYDDSLIDIAAAAALIHDHRQKLRRAA